jgi:hypothetical protein
MLTVLRRAAGLRTGRPRSQRASSAVSRLRTYASPHVLGLAEGHGSAARPSPTAGSTGLGGGRHEGQRRQRWRRGLGAGPCGPQPGRCGWR